MPCKLFKEMSIWMWIQGVMSSIMVVKLCYLPYSKYILFEFHLISKICCISLKWQQEYCRSLPRTLSSSVLYHVRIWMLFEELERPSDNLCSHHLLKWWISLLKEPNYNHLVISPSAPKQVAKLRRLTLKILHQNRRLL